MRYEIDDSHYAFDDNLRNTSYHNDYIAYKLYDVDIIENDEITEYGRYLFNYFQLIIGVERVTFSSDYYENFKCIFIHFNKLLVSKGIIDNCARCIFNEEIDNFKSILKIYKTERLYFSKEQCFLSYYESQGGYVCSYSFPFCLFNNSQRHRNEISLSSNYLTDNARIFPNLSRFGKKVFIAFQEHLLRPYTMFANCLLSIVITRYSIFFIYDGGVHRMSYLTNNMYHSSVISILENRRFNFYLHRKNYTNTRYSFNDLNEYLNSCNLSNNDERPIIIDERPIIIDYPDLFHPRRNEFNDNQEFFSVNESREYFSNLFNVIRNRVSNVTLANHNYITFDSISSNNRDE